MRAEPRQDLGSAPTPVGSTPLDLLWAEANRIQDMRVRRHTCGSEGGNRVVADLERQMLDVLRQIEGTRKEAVLEAIFTRSVGVTDAVATPKDGGGQR